MNDGYENFWKNVGMTQRKHTSHDDAYAIYTFKSDAEQAWEFFKDALLGFVLVAIFGGGAIGLLYMLAR